MRTMEFFRFATLSVGVCAASFANSVSAGNCPNDVVNMVIKDTVKVYKINAADIPGGATAFHRIDQATRSCDRSVFLTFHPPAVPIPAHPCAAIYRP
jgi:hypothetical protein